MMCDDGQPSYGNIIGTQIGISIWNSSWTNNKQYIAPIGNCIYVSGLSGGDFVQFGKSFMPRNYLSKTQSNLADSSQWCMTSNATTIVTSGIETTSQFNWMNSGRCYAFGSGQDWHDSIWSIQPQNTGGENEQRYAITSNTFTGVFQLLQNPKGDGGPITLDADYSQLIGTNGYIRNTNTTNGLAITSTLSTENSYYLNKWIPTKTYTTPIIVNFGIMYTNDYFSNTKAYLCYNNDSETTITPWSIIPETTPGNDNYQETVYPFFLGNDNTLCS